jgi:hypothetical protein
MNPCSNFLTLSDGVINLATVVRVKFAEGMTTVWYAGGHREDVTDPTDREALEWACELLTSEQGEAAFTR